MSHYSQETLDAILASAEKWATQDPEDLGGHRSCPLCQLHRKEVRGGKNVFSIFVVCAGCPIRDKTGKHACEGSPYDAFFYANNDDSATTAARAFSYWLLELHEAVR